jgi:hypothetical protein
LPFYVAAQDKRFFLTATGIRDFEMIRNPSTIEAGWGVALRGSLDAGDVDRFIADNGLVHTQRFDNVPGEVMREKGIARWEHHRPEHPDWYTRRQPRYPDACRLCEALWLVDRQSGRLWIHAGGPDFAGD